MENPRRRKATGEGIAAELIALLNDITADGRISDDEAQSLRAWLDDNQATGIASIEALRSLLAQTLAAGVLGDRERKALLTAIERVLPPDLRAMARAQRQASETMDKLAARQDRDRQRADAAERRRLNEPVHRADFMVAGVAHEGRDAIIDRSLQPGHEVFLLREPDNRHDVNATQVCLESGECIGYVPREEAREIAPLLDSGHQHAAYCKKILEGGRVSTPVVMAEFFDPAAALARVASPDRIESVRAAQAQKKEQDANGCLAGCVALLVVATILFYWLFIR